MEFESSLSRAYAALHDAQAALRDAIPAAPTPAAATDVAVLMHAVDLEVDAAVELWHRHVGGDPQA